ncbi:MAG TPA: Rab family GTPase [Candidatus Lokiarchaeia archaeon]
MIHSDIILAKKRAKSYKVFLFGDGGVGKTTLVCRALKRKFQFDTPMTIGTNYYIKHFKIEGIKALFQIWDFGGEDRFRYLIPLYAQGSDGGIFMYDITRRSSLLCIDDWLNTFKQSLNKEKREIPILLVGGKLDLEHRRSVFNDDLFKVKRAHNFYAHFECSSKSRENVEKIFKILAQAILMNDNYRQIDK